MFITFGRAARASMPRNVRWASTSKEFPRPLYFTALDPCAVKRYISPWHEIPLQPANAPAAVFNFICEIPRGSRAKFEIDTSSRYTPIIQDSTKAGLPRSYALDSIVNYGALPQTYEDPAQLDPLTNAPGDGDPLDVCEIGTARLATTGSAYTVKVIGALAMLDGGECDWKLLAVRTDDPLAASVSDVTLASTPDAVKRTADAVREWFRTYKIPEGKGENSFAFGGAWLDLSKTMQIIAHTHSQWRAPLTVPPKGQWVPGDGLKLPSPATFAPAAGKSELSRLTTTDSSPPSDPASALL